MHFLTKTAFSAFVGFLLPAALLAQNPLTFDKTFLPDTIGPGSVSTLRFDITNNTSSGARGVAFTDNLPSGVVIASTPNVKSTCAGGSISAPAGGSTISFSDGGVGASSSCSIRVDVTSSAVGTHVNTSGTLTADIGSGGTAADELTVAANRPGFSKSFSPNPANFGGRTILTFTVDNSANSSQAFNLSFMDNLPLGMTVADPSNATSTCNGGAITAVPGSSVVSYQTQSGGFDAFVGAGAVCAITVDVIAGAVGMLDNVTSELTSNVGGFLVSSGKASATLTVNVARLSLIKSFTDDPVAPGDTANLQFTINNLDRRSGVNDISFSDDLDAVVSGLAATGLPSNPCGSGSTISGSSVITLTGGNLPPEGSCTFSVTLQVPSSAGGGNYLNTTSSITGTSDLGEGVSGAGASDQLTINVGPVLTKTFLDNPVGAGGSATLEFSITNPSSATFSEMTFEDVFDVVLPSASSVPEDDFCGDGSTAMYTPRFPGGGSSGSIPARLVISGAVLAPGTSCTFSLALDVASDAPETDVFNTTSAITGLSGGEVPVNGDPATDTLVIVGGPEITKEFTDDPVLPGDTVTLQFTITHSEFASGSATGIAFSDDLTNALTGLSATGLPQTDVCGAGSQIDGTTNLLFSNGTLAAGESCTFSITLQVPSDAPFGVHTNTTSALVATVGGVAATNAPTTDDLVVAGLTLSKEFTDDPALPGATVTLSFTIENLSAAETAASIQFDDQVDGSLSGLLVATGQVPQNDICGTGSSLTSANGRTLNFRNGSLDPETSCTFSVTLDVPSDAPTDDYPNVTSSFVAIIGGQQVALENAFDFLRVNADILEIAKEFTDDPVAPGGLVTLRFTVDNLDPNRSVTSIEFVDDLDAVFSGLTSVSGVLTDVCGSGSQISGVSLLSLTGGNLAPAGMAGDSCTFDVILQVPAGVELSSVGLNETSQVTGLADGVSVIGNVAGDSLLIDFLVFAKSFAADALPGGTVDLTFNIQNLDDSNPIDGLSFLDDLDAVISGLTAVGLPASDVCGSGSLLEGTSVLSFSGGNLLPAGSCTFDVTLQVPSATSPGSYFNTTSDLQQGGLSVSDPATASLVVLEPPEVQGVVVLATNSIWLRQNSSVLSGDVVAINASSGPYLASGVELTVGIGASTPAGWAIKADSIKVKSNATVNSDAFYNELDGTVLGSQTTPISLPVISTLPEFVEGTPGTQDITVEKNDFLILDPGAYGIIKVKQGGTVVFSGGVYDVAEIDFGTATTMTFQAPTEVRVAEKFALDQNSLLGPATGSGIDATDIVFYVAGINGGNGNLGATPKAAQFGTSTVVEANFYVPNGTLLMKQNSDVTGAFFGKDVQVGIGVEVNLNSRFGN